MEVTPSVEVGRDETRQLSDLHDSRKWRLRVTDSWEHQEAAKRAGPFDADVSL